LAFCCGCIFIFIFILMTHYSLGCLWMTWQKERVWLVDVYVRVESSKEEEACMQQVKSDTKKMVFNLPMPVWWSLEAKNREEREREKNAKQGTNPTICNSNPGVDLLLLDLYSPYFRISLICISIFSACFSFLSISHCQS
jgi:hypothetical protein